MKKVRHLVAVLLAASAGPALAEFAAMPAAVPAAASAPVQFEVFLPLRNKAALDALVHDQQTVGSPSYHKWLTPSQFAKRFGPSDDAIAAARAAIQAQGLNVDKVNARSLHVTGSASGVSRLLGVSLGTVRIAGKTQMVSMRKPVMTPALQALGAKVIHFSGIPPHQPLVTLANSKALPDNRYGPDGAYWFTDLKQAYDYPALNSKLLDGNTLDGTGVHAAALMADLITPGDLDNFFNHEKFSAISGRSNPKVDIVKIDGGGKVGGPAALEASLDVQQISSGAPGATTTLISLPDLSDDSIIDGYTYIVNSNKYDIVSSSFGECEQFYLPAYNNGEDETYILQTYEELFQQGNAQGITFLASSGDNGGKECTTLSYLQGRKGQFIRGVSTPAASKFVTAVGGGNLVTKSDGTFNSAYVSENGYGDPLVPYDPYGTGGLASGGIWGAGGGWSVIFTQPSAQYGTRTGTTTARTVPDVGMQVGGCPGTATTPCGPHRSAAVVAYNGRYLGVIGTSVSSPELAGAIALYIQKQNGRVGNINTFLYERGMAQTAAGGINAPAAKQYYHRNIPGYDGVYTDTVPSANYNYIVGNGTPDVRKLFDMTQLAPAGLPQTITNP